MRYDERSRTQGEKANVGIGQKATDMKQKQNSELKTPSHKKCAMAAEGPPREDMAVAKNKTRRL